MTPDGQPFGQWLRRVREARGLSLRDVERMTGGGLKRGVVSNIETGWTQNPGFHHVALLVAAYALDPRDVFRAALARAEGPAPPGGGECSKAAADDTECPACALAIDAEQCGSAHCWKLRRCPACGAPVALFITNPQAEAARRLGCSECDWIEQQSRLDGSRS